jgi:hypothetical protein
VCVCLCILLIVAKQRLGKNHLIVARKQVNKNPLIVARQWLCRNVTAVTNTHVAIDEFVYRIFFAVNTTMNKINNTGVCFTYSLLSLHVSILMHHHQVIVSIHLNKILQLLKGLCD